MVEITINQVDVAKLNVQPGEILMIKVDGILNDELASRIKDAFLRAFQESGGNVPTMLVIDDKIHAEVVRGIPQTPEREGM